MGSSKFDRRVWLLLAAMLVFRFGQGLYFPFSTIYFHNFVGIPLSLVGVGLATLAAASVVSGLISGPLTDRYGRKPVMLAVGFLLYYVFTQDWQALPVYARNFLDVPETRIGLFLAGNGLMVVLFQLPIAYLLDGRSKVAALAVGAMLFVASSATLLVTESFLGILVAFAGFFTLAERIPEVAGAALAAELAPQSGVVPTSPSR